MNKPEIDLHPSLDPYDPQVYQQGKTNFQSFISNNWLVSDACKRFYLYSQAFEGQSTQYGLVCASSIEDYETNKIKKHEKTLQKKEEDRTKLTDI